MAETLLFIPFEEKHQRQNIAAATMAAPVLLEHDPEISGSWALAA